LTGLSVKSLIRILDNDVSSEGENNLKIMEGLEVRTSIMLVYLRTMMTNISYVLTNCEVE